MRGSRLSILEYFLGGVKIQAVRVSWASAQIEYLPPGGLNEASRRQKKIGEHFPCKPGGNQHFSPRYRKNRRFGRAAAQAVSGTSNGTGTGTGTGTGIGTGAGVSSRSPKGLVSQVGPKTAPGRIQQATFSYSSGPAPKPNNQLCSSSAERAEF